MEIKKGEVWRIASSEFEGIIRVLDDIDTGKEMQFKAEIFEGKIKSEKEEDLGIGKEISINTKQTRWRAKIY